MGRKKKIVQILPILSRGDAIGNEVLAMDDALNEAGFDSEIYAESIDHSIKRKNIRPISRYRDKSDQVIIYHLSTGHILNRRVAFYKAPLVIHYHNITPPVYFHGYNALLEQVCSEGITDAGWLKDKAVLCLADSEYNKQDLIRMGYSCPIEVLPILIAFEDFKKAPDPQIAERYKINRCTNIIFTGRIAPNKKQEDLIRSFYYYNRYLNGNSMLHIIGGYESGGRYYKRLVEYTKQLGLTDYVNFTGHIPFNQILAYYQLADVFLCLSEHEGFCVPLVEAMCFQVPIIAFDSTAVGETLGDGGILLDDKAPALVAETIHYLQEHQDLRRLICENEKHMLELYSADRIKKKLLSVLKSMMC